MATMPSPHLPPAAVASLNATLFHRHNLTIRKLPPTHSRRSHPPPLLSILFPDWEAFLLLPLPSAAGDHHNLSCLFHNGAVSPASFVGILPTSPARSAFRCPIPTSIRRCCPFCTPRLIDPTTAAPESDGHDPRSKMIRWTCLAYEAVSTPSNVIVFAKGVNSFQRINCPASDLRCLFSSSAGGVTAPVAATPVTSSAQEVFRCLQPPRHRHPLEIKNRRGPPHLPPNHGRREPNPLPGRAEGDGIFGGAGAGEGAGGIIEGVAVGLGHADLNTWEYTEGRHVAAFAYAPLQQNSSFPNALHVLRHASPALSFIGHRWLRSTTHPVTFDGSDVRQGFRQRGNGRGLSG